MHLRTDVRVAEAGARFLDCGLKLEEFFHGFALVLGAFIVAVKIARCKYFCCN
jgi:1,4-dihydroxy-2-naphthoyl-CoA synthase